MKHEIVDRFYGEHDGGYKCSCGYVSPRYFFADWERDWNKHRAESGDKHDPSSSAYDAEYPWPNPKDAA